MRLQVLGRAAKFGVRLPHASFSVREFGQDNGVVLREFRAIHLNFYSSGDSLKGGEFGRHQIGRPVNQGLFPAGAPLIERDLGEIGIGLCTSGCSDRQERD